MTMGTQAKPGDDMGDDEMPEEIDFSQGTRGKFFKPGLHVNLPVYLEASVGACQDSCRLVHAASGCLSMCSECAWSNELHSGLRVSAPTGDQSVRPILAMSRHFLFAGRHW